VGVATGDGEGGRGQAGTDRREDGVGAIRPVPGPLGWSACSCDSMGVPALVFATSAPFWPPLQGDSARVFSLVRYFTGAGWDVHVVHLASQSETAPDYPQMRRRCRSLTVYRPSPDDRRLQEGSDRCDDWCPDAFARLVAARVQTSGARVVIAQFVYLSRCLETIEDRGVLKILDADNVFAGREDRFAAHALGYWWFSTDQDEETRCLRRADLLLAVQAEEGRVLRARTGRPVLVVPYVAPTRPCPPGSGATVLFVGSASPVNIRAVEEFVTTGLPAVRARVPAAELVVCGAVSEHAPTGGGVRPMGIVADLRTFYEQAMLVINPAVTGTGLSIKTVDALANGKALVATEAAVAGVPEAVTAARVVPTPDAVPGAVADLLTRPDVVHRLERRAALLARTHFSGAELARLGEVVSQAGSRR
jgi:hypothetical protein